MINESYPWKRDLLKDADIIERWAAKITASESRDALIENKIFLSAYVIRKLIENYKLTDKAAAGTVKCRLCRTLGRKVDTFNRHDIDKLYDFSSHIKSSIPIVHLANQIVHSLIFAFENSIDEDSSPICGFWVASDWQKDKHLCGINLNDYLSVMRMVGSNQVVEIRSERTEKGWKISSR